MYGLAGYFWLVTSVITKLTFMQFSQPSANSSTVTPKTPQSSHALSTHVLPLR
jgi:hypothetical protein